MIGKEFMKPCTSWSGCGREKPPSRVRGVWIGSRSRMWAANREARGYDAGKQITGRKRHLLVDTLGLPIAVKVTAASKSDQAGARQLFSAARDKFKGIKKIWVDGTYRGKEWHEKVRAEYGIALEVKKNETGAKGFVAQAKRWVVERTFGWFVQSRRLVREYEKLTHSTEAMIHLTMIRMLVRRLAPDFSD